MLFTDTTFLVIVLRPPLAARARWLPTIEVLTHLVREVLSLPALGSAASNSRFTPSPDAPNPLDDLFLLLVSRVGVSTGVERILGIPPSPTYQPSSAAIRDPGTKHHQPPNTLVRALDHSP
ncbi:hypothetical protein FRC12_002759 [Ceratobasidium sp. 428]|nr:hypothetical protein FRC12_002759 [Ceratobasidium sp. 428]